MTQLFIHAGKPFGPPSRTGTCTHVITVWLLHKPEDNAEGVHTHARTRTHTGLSMHEVANQFRIN